MLDQEISIAEAMERAVADHRAGRLLQAEEIYKRVLASDPNHADALHLAGVVAIQVGKSAEALPLIERAIEQDGKVSRYHSSLSLALHNLDRSEAAMVHCRIAIRLEPSNVDAYVTHGHIYRSLNNLAAAEASYRHALARAPDHLLALMNLANTLQEAGFFEDAETHYRQLLQKAPEFPDGHKNFAVALCLRGHLDQAITEMREAVHLKPDEPAWRMALGQLLLLDGQLSEGWRYYESRWQTPNVPSKPRGFKQPQWNGEAIGDKVLLLHAEQGFGDTIQFCRYLPLAAQRARVVLEAPRPLVTLLASLPGVEKIVVTGEKLPPFDYHCPLMTLARLEGTTLETIPNAVPYLSADITKIGKWKRRLQTKPGLKVGLAWAGGIVTPRNHQRSIQPEKLAALADIPGVTFVSLQKYQLSSMAQSAPAALKLHDWTDALTDLADTAALVSALDLVISVDTSVAHLAGALGKPTWLLNRFSPDWRWLLQREDSAWYPTLRQFRQESPDDWEPVLARVRSELEKLVGNTSD